MEILFRGFHKCDGPDTAIIDGAAERGRWVYGYYVKKVDPFLPGIEKDFILTMDENSVSIWNMVDPSTVGQWTGLTDKTGKKIFQGDRVQYLASRWSGIKNEEFLMRGTIEFDHAAFRFTCDDPNYGKGFVGYVGRPLEIIGTIYDAPPEGA